MVGIEFVIGRRIHRVGWGDRAQPHNWATRNKEEEPSWASMGAGFSDQGFVEYFFGLERRTAKLVSKWSCPRRLHYFHFNVPPKPWQCPDSPKCDHWHAYPMGRPEGNAEFWRAPLRQGLVVAVFCGASPAEAGGCAAPCGRWTTARLETRVHAAMCCGRRYCGGDLGRASHGADNDDDFFLVVLLLEAATHLLLVLRFRHVQPGRLREHAGIDDDVGRKGPNFVRIFDVQRVARLERRRFL